jgi:hypothetical protein
VDDIAQIRAEGAAAPRAGLGIGRQAFGISRDQSKRLEVTFVLKNGGSITAVTELDDALSAETLAAFAEQLTADVAAGTSRSFTDGWATSGQHVWVSLGDVAAFALRPLK